MRRALVLSEWTNVTKLSAAYFLSTLYFYIPVYALYLQSRGLSFVQINSLWGVIVGTMFLTEVPTGIFADRLGRKRSINIALGLQFLGEIIFIFAKGYWPFALAAVTGGLGFAFSSGAVEALVYDSLQQTNQESDMSRAMGLLSAAQRAANLLAFAVGGILVINLTQERFVLAIMLTALMVAAGWLVSLTLEEPRARKPGRAGGRSATLLADGLRRLFVDRRFRRLALLAVLTVPFSNYLLNLYQPRFVELGVPPFWLGAGLAVASGLSMAVARYAYVIAEHLGTRLSLLLVSGLPGILYLLFALSTVPSIAVAVFCLLYGSMSLKDPVFSAHLNRHIESANRATVLSLISMFSGIYVALVGLLIGLIADVSLAYAFGFMGAVVLAGTAMFWPTEP
jgi:MFS family permease